MYRSISIKYLCRIAKSMKNEVSILEEKLNAIDIPNSIDNEIRKNEIKGQLDKFNEKITRTNN